MLGKREKVKLADFTAQLSHDSLMATEVDV